jgi:hypothetical protein
MAKHAIEHQRNGNHQSMIAGSRLEDAKTICHHRGRLHIGRVSVARGRCFFFLFADPRYHPRECKSRDASNDVVPCAGKGRGASGEVTLGWKVSVSAPRVIRRDGVGLLIRYSVRNSCPIVIFPLPFVTVVVFWSRMPAAWLPVIERERSPKNLGLLRNAWVPFPDITCPVKVLLFT